MEHQPKTEPESGSSDDDRKLEDMSIPELVSVLRTAYKTEDFDRVEDVLMVRYHRLHTDILHLQEKFEIGKRARNNYEKLLKEVKKNTSLTDRNINGELRRKKNNALELEELESDKKIVPVKSSDQLEKSMKKNSDDPTDPEDKNGENVSGYISKVESAVLQRNEPPTKGSNDGQGPSSSSSLSPSVMSGMGGASSSPRLPITVRMHKRFVAARKAFVKLMLESALANKFSSVSTTLSDLLVGVLEFYKEIMDVV